MGKPAATSWYLPWLQVQEGPSHCLLRLLAEVQVPLTGPGELLTAEEIAAAPANAHKSHLSTQRMWRECGCHAGEHCGPTIQGAGHVAHDSEETSCPFQVQARPPGTLP